jgi:transposase
VLTLEPLLAGTRSCPACRELRKASLAQRDALRRPKLRFLGKRHFRFTPKADSRGLMLIWSLRVNSDLACHQQVRPCPRCIASAIKDRLLWVNGAARDVIEDPKLESWIVRYELSDFEWAAIKPFLPNKSRGVRRVNDRRVLNGIFWVLRSGAPWRDLPVCYGPRTTCYNRFVRWRKAGEWDRIMDSLAAAHDAAVQMIDTSVVRVHQHAACIARNRSQSMGRSRGGLTSKIHAVVDTNGLPVRLGLTAGEAHDNQLALSLLSRLKSGSMLLADRGYDADWIRAFATERGAWANVPPRSNRREPICFSPHLYRARNLIERFFNKIKQCRLIATRYDKLAANYLAFVQLASIRLWLRVL